MTTKAAVHRGEQPNTQTQALRDAAMVRIEAGPLTLDAFTALLPDSVGATSPEGPKRKRCRREAARKILTALCDDGRAMMRGDAYVVGPARAEAA